MTTSAQGRGAAVPAGPPAPVPASGLPGLDPLAPRRSPAWTVLFLVLVTGLWCLAVFGSTSLDLGRPVRHVFRFVHVMALTLGFGSVLAVDVCGLAVLLRRRTPHFATRVAATVDPAIWAGYLLVVLSGAALRPDLDSVAIWCKLAAALAAGLNGVIAHGAMRALLAVPPQSSAGAVPRRLMARAALHAGVSQGAWWTAAVIGGLVA
jgi:hypothetical protein